MGEEDIAGFGEKWISEIEQKYPNIEDCNKHPVRKNFPRLGVCSTKIKWI